MTSGSRRTWPGADLPGRRLFVAAPLPEGVVHDVEALVDAVKAPGVPGGGRDVRWVRLDGLHLTLRFLGPTLEDRVGPTAAAVREAAERIASFDAVLGGGGAFPSLERPRALWLDVLEGGDALAAAASVLDAALVEAGWEPETRPLRAHLTLARSDGVSAGAAIAARLVALAADVRLTAAIDRIGLFESVTGGGPARYDPIDLIELRRP
jgi:2'-5' RNA ligase